MMNDKKVHEIKLQQQFCDDVYCGVKTFEIRKNDRDYKVGDVIRFVPIDENGYKVTHSIADRRYEITYLLTNWGLQEGYVGLGIKQGSEKKEEEQKINEKNYVYLMITSNGSFEDYHEFVRVASLDKSKVEIAVKEYNNRIEKAISSNAKIDEDEEIFWSWGYLEDEHPAKIQKYELT